MSCLSCTVGSFSTLIIRLKAEMLISELKDRNTDVFHSLGAPEDWQAETMKLGNGLVENYRVSEIYRARGIHA